MSAAQGNGIPNAHHHGAHALVIGFRAAEMEHIQGTALQGDNGITLVMGFALDAGIGDVLGGAVAQKEKLESEGHTIIQRGRKNIRYYVKDYESVLFSPDSEL